MKKKKNKEINFLTFATIQCIPFLNFWKYNKNNYEILYFNFDSVLPIF